MTAIRYPLYLTRPIYRPALVILALALCAAALAFNDYDFHNLYAAGLAARTGANPYNVTEFISPLSVLIYFTPVSLLPYALAFRLTAFISAAAYILVFYRAARGSLLVTFLIGVSPLLLYNVFAINIDWMPLLAAMVNPVAGFFFALTKPQTGSVLAVILWWIVLRRYGWQVAALLIIAQAAIFAASILLYSGAATGAFLKSSINHPGNLSLFPWGLLLGLPLAWYALRRRDRFAGLAAAPLLSPYVGPQSWIAVLPLAARRWWIILLLDVLAWGIVAYLLIH